MSESNAVYADDDIFTGPNGEKLRYKYIRMTASRIALGKQRTVLKKLDPAKKADFYYKVYQALDRQSIATKSDPFFQIGISPYTFMNEAVRIGGFDTSYGEVFSRMHMAFLEVAANYEFDK
jgi:hypothetical protein